jgi:hypothetical protein
MQVEQATEPAEKPQVVKYAAQNATRPICPIGVYAPLIN